MIENLVLDTNILIYNLDKKSKYFLMTEEILMNTKYNFFITSKNISEFVSVLSKYSFGYQNIYTEVSNIVKNFRVLFPSDASVNIFIQLLNKYKPRRNRVFDIEIVSIMLANNIDKIATVNIKDFKDINEISLI